MIRFCFAALLTLAVVAVADSHPASPHELLRLAPGTKTFLTHNLNVNQARLADGGTDVSATAHVSATLRLPDGGMVTLDLGGASCQLSATEKTALRAVLAAAALKCGRDAP
jgi:hypothetical protein